MLSLSRCRHGTALPDYTSSWLQEQIYTVSIWDTKHELAAVINWGVSVLAALHLRCNLKCVTFIELHAFTAAVLAATHAQTNMELKYRSPMTKMTGHAASYACLAKSVSLHTVMVSGSMPRAHRKEFQIRSERMTRHNS